MTPETKESVNDDVSKMPTGKKYHIPTLFHDRNPLLSNRKRKAQERDLRATFGGEIMKDSVYYVVDVDITKIRQNKEVYIGPFNGQHGSMKYDSKIPMTLERALDLEYDYIPFQ